MREKAFSFEQKYLFNKKIKEDGFCVTEFIKNDEIIKPTAKETIFITTKFGKYPVGSLMKLVTRIEDMKNCVFGKIILSLFRIKL